MTALTNEINYRTQELERVATGLRTERTVATTAQSATRRMRLALGNALIQLGTGLTAGQRQLGAQAR